MSVETDLAKVKKELAEFQSAKIQAEARLKALEEEKEDLLKECASFGVEPSKLEEECQRLEAALASEIEKVRQGLEAFNALKA